MEISTVAATQSKLLAEVTIAVKAQDFFTVFPKVALSTKNVLIMIAIPDAESRHKLEALLISGDIKSPLKLTTLDQYQRAGWVSQEIRNLITRIQKQVSPRVDNSPYQFYFSTSTDGQPPIWSPPPIGTFPAGFMPEATGAVA